MTLKKLKKLKPELLNSADGYKDVRRTIGNSLLDPDDAIGDVLKEGDFVIISESLDE